MLLYAEYLVGRHDGGMHCFSALNNFPTCSRLLIDATAAIIVIRTELSFGM
jgi:hypothetical protein